MTVNVVPAFELVSTVDTPSRRVGIQVPLNSKQAPALTADPVGNSQVTVLVKANTPPAVILAAAELRVPSIDKLPEPASNAIVPALVALEALKKIHPSIA